MAGEIMTTVVGNLVDAPELRFTPNGAPVLKARIASTPRTYDSATQGFKDGMPTFLTITCWRSLAENVAASELEKGTRVVAYGKLENREYEDKEGNKRTSLELTADAFGPDLTWRTATVGDGAHDGAKKGKARAAKADPFEGATTERPAAAQHATGTAQAAAAGQAAESPASDW